MAERILIIIVGRTVAMSCCDLAAINFDSPVSLIEAQKFKNRQVKQSAQLHCWAGFSAMTEGFHAET